MKYILEFARFSDISKSNNDEINNIINKKYEDNERLIFDVYLKKYDKNIILKWNNTKYHNIIDKIKSRTSFKNTRNFNNTINKGINYFFNNYFDEIDKTNRYALHFIENNFFLIIDINYDNLFSKYTQIYISTINISTPNNVYKTIEINEDNFEY